MTTARGDLPHDAPIQGVGRSAVIIPIQTSKVGRLFETDAIAVDLGFKRVLVPSTVNRAATAPYYHRAPPYSRGEVHLYAGGW